jgi:hypothetical protein
VQPIAPTVSRTIHELQVQLDAVLDLREPAALTELSLTVDDLVGEDYELCQMIGGAAAFLGIDGLIVKSARAEGSNAVILFAATATTPIVEVLSSRVA